MGGHLCTIVPPAIEQLVPRWSHTVSRKHVNVEVKENQKRNFDHHHQVHNLPLLSNHHKPQ